MVFNCDHYILTLERDAPMYSTGELAHEAGVSPYTVRYYLDEDLLPEPPRAEGEHRRFGQSAVERIRFIKRAQSLGFSLDQIRQLLEFEGNPQKRARLALDFAKDSLDEVQSKVRRKRELRQFLEELIEKSESTDTPGKPILNYLQGELD